MCKLQEPAIKQLNMSDPVVEITVPQSAELSQANARWIINRLKVSKSYRQNGEIGTRRPVKIHMLGQEGCQEFQLDEQKFKEQVKKANEKNKNSREAKK